MKFDGRGFAKIIEDEVKTHLRQKASDGRGKVLNLVKKPRIVSVLVGSDPASALYTKLKEQAAHRVGIEFEVQRIANIEYLDLVAKISEIGAREDVTGVMVQLPIPGLQGQALQEVLSAIPKSKDVDGLRYPESGIVPPVVTAVVRILKEIGGRKSLEHWEKKFVVVGAGGFVGSALCSELAKRGVEVIKIESDTQDPTRTVLEGDIVISCVGKEGVVTGEMVKDEGIAVDVGAPMGDMTREVYQKALISVEVPGGVGPVTIACLLENAVDIYDNRVRVYSSG
jgi:methylenetetrahydrofolate dehydrogenase (NADP+)/methenyltetrahydrofolate cyclohydrolase